MSPGRKQQHLKDDLRERFIAGPSKAALKAMVSANDREQSELISKLRRERQRVKALEKELHETRSQLTKTRLALAKQDPAANQNCVRAL